MSAIESTKSLSLEQRVAIVDEILASEFPGKKAADLTNRQKTKFAKSIQARGYEPMMFAAACRIVMSRRD